MYPPLLELWTIAIAAAEAATIAAIRARILTPAGVVSERRLLEDELRWASSFSLR